MFDVTFLPATIGDSIWIRYGEPGSTHNILIDGGTRGTRKHIKNQVEAITDPDPHLELIVVSHIDKDHIGGVLSILQRDEFEATVGDIWFNALQHLPESEDDEHLGAKQGEALTKEIIRHGLSWNGAYGPSGVNAVVIPQSGQLPVKTLPGGMKLTLLSPTLEALKELRPVWDKEVKEAGMEPGAGAIPDDPTPDGDEAFGADEIPDVDALADTPFNGDDSEANGSSIAFLAEFDGKRALFAADAHVPVILDGIDLICPGQTLEIDLFKISHHGSKGTVSRPLIERVASPTYVFSTNGSIFRHPHRESVARVIAGAGDHPELVFNYRSISNEIWGLIEGQHGYRTRYPDGNDGVTVSL